MNILLNEVETKIIERCCQYLYVGIDPGVNTGICIYNSDTKEIIKLLTLDFWDTITLFTRLAEMQHYFCIDEEIITVIIENSALNKPTFSKAGGETARKMQKISRNVGSNQRESVLLIEGIRRMGFAVKEVRPSGKKGMKRKWSKEVFENITGWKKQSSQHSRDAAMLVFGR